MKGKLGYGLAALVGAAIASAVFVTQEQRCCGVIAREALARAKATVGGWLS